MSYATLADLTARIGDVELRQIADRNRDMQPDDEVIASALADADNLIDGYVAVKYDVPLATAPAIVKTWAVMIARYFLHHNGAPDHVVRDYDNAIAALKDVSAGRSALPVAAGAEPLSGAGGEVMGEHPAEVFTADRLRGW